MDHEGVHFLEQDVERRPLDSMKPPRLSTSMTPSILRRELLGREDRLKGQKRRKGFVCTAT